ncbi:MAG: hypothetical protein E6I90_13995 [Chloroflexi bacterium]|nr:MAG: hypothetical protein E6I90_13995 [Chloroflexota bacterium]
MFFHLLHDGIDQQERAMSVQARRAAQVRAGVRIEIFTIIWMVVEAAVLFTSIYGLVTRSRSEGSAIGIAISASAILVMPWLAFTKRRIAARIDSGALRGDAASSLTCGYMAGAVLVGVLLNTLFHWWWAEDVAALVFLIFLFQETREALEEARGDEDDE